MWFWGWGWFTVFLLPLFRRHVNHVYSIILWKLSFCIAWHFISMRISMDFVASSYCMSKETTMWTYRLRLFLIICLISRVSTWLSLIYTCLKSSNIRCRREYSSWDTKLYILVNSGNISIMIICLLAWANDSFKRIRKRTMFLLSYNWFQLSLDPHVHFP